MQLLFVMHGVFLFLKNLGIPVFRAERCLRLIIKLGQKAREFVIWRHFVSYPIEIADK